MVDLRFGHGREKHSDERARRIQAAKRLKLLLKRENAKQKDFEDTMQQVVIVGAVILMTLGLFVMLFKVLL